MRWVIALLALVLVTLQLDLWFGENRIPRLHGLRQQLAEQTAVNQALLERNEDLIAEIRNLREGSEAAEERARSELGLVLPDESFFQLAESP